MLSGRLIRLIESHHTEITDRILREIQRSSELTHLCRIPNEELRERSQVLVEHLGDWLAGKNQEIALEQETVGKRRYEQNVPLHEVVQGLCIVKNSMIDFIEEQGIPRDCLGLYAEEELEHRIGRFFDTLVIHMARGYEAAWQISTRAAA